MPAPKPIPDSLRRCVCQRLDRGMDRVARELHCSRYAVERVILGDAETRRRAAVRVRRCRERARLAQQRD